MRMRHIVICVLPALLYYSHCLVNDTIFGKISLNIKLLSETFFIPRRLARYCKMCKAVHVYSTRYSCQILMKPWIFSTDFRRIPKYEISWKFVQWKASCSMRRDVRTDSHSDTHDESNSLFLQFCERPWKQKKEFVSLATLSGKL